MSQLLTRLMHGVHPTEPSKEDLFRILTKLLTSLSFNNAEREIIKTAFDISFEGHRFAPRRASGEIYFMHIMRQVAHTADLMYTHGVRSVKLLIMELLHDTVEDAEKGGSTRFIAKSQIHLLLGDETAYAVMCMTKKKDIESRSEFLLRIIACDVWEVLVAKPADCDDNIVTLSAVALEKQPGKVREVFEFYPRIEEKTIHLITITGDKGELEHPERWISMVKALHRTLRKNAHKEQLRLEALGIKVV